MTYNSDKYKAEDLLDELYELKIRERLLQKDIKAVQALLAIYVESGNLDHLKAQASNTYRFKETNFVYCPGRVTWSYDGCEDVQAALENLKELQETAQFYGQAVRKQGKSFFTVR